MIMKVEKFKGSVKSMDLLRVAYRPVFNDWVVSYYDDYVICQNLKEVKSHLNDISTIMFEI